MKKNNKALISIYQIKIKIKTKKINQHYNKKKLIKKMS